MSKDSKFRLFIAAGGTGGHLFPALAVVEEIHSILQENFEAHFVGNANKIEARIVPSKGYKFNSIPITGFTGINFNAFFLPFKIFLSISKCRKIISNFKPDAVLCTGAYISYPAGIASSIMGVPLILMESNVNPGKTIRLLSPRASIIFTSFEETSKYFSNAIQSRIKYIGNPIRKDIMEKRDKKQAAEEFGLNPFKKTVLIFGGSLGAKSINIAVENNLELFANTDVQYIWQTGNNFEHKKPIPKNFKVLKFIDDMASAYSIADLVISRAGATTIAEITAIGKPSILIPLASASNNEQFLNAKYLEDKGASLMLHNEDLSNKIFEIITKLIDDDEKLNRISKQALSLGTPESGKLIAKFIIENYYLSK